MRLLYQRYTLNTFSEYLDYKDYDYRKGSRRKGRRFAQQISMSRGFMSFLVNHDKTVRV